MTCNRIFWQVVVPTVTFGSEVWVNSKKDEELLLTFQRYAGRRVQRFPQRAPNSSSFYGLGWLKLNTYIKVKKPILDHRNVIRKSSESRLNIIYQCVEKGRGNVYRSPIF